CAGPSRSRRATRSPSTCDSGSTTEPAADGRRPARLLSGRAPRRGNSVADVVAEQPMSRPVPSRRVSSVRVLAACSLGGAGHLQPLLPLRDAVLRRGHETLVIGPPGLGGMVEAADHPFTPGEEPPEAAIAPIREQLPVLPTREATQLGNRELFEYPATA